MADATDRAVAALEDVVGVERDAPGEITVVTVSDTHAVDARQGDCDCPDQEYNLGPSGRCKHQYAALLATADMPSPWTVTHSLDTRPVADGGRGGADVDDETSDEPHCELCAGDGPGCFDEFGGET